MYTLCPNCNANFEVLSKHLSAANGMIQCNTCNRVFNALESLTDKPIPKENLFNSSGILGESLDLSDLKLVREKIVEYYHKRILHFYKGTNKTLDLPHMHFDKLKKPEIILHNKKPLFIGHIEIDQEGISNFIHNTPLTISSDDKVESISMQDFITWGRLTSLSTIRQKDENDPDKAFYAYQTINDEKSEKQEIFPLLRAGSTKASYLLRKQLNLLLTNKVKQLDLSSDMDEYKWINENNDSFENVCQRLGIVILNKPEQITLRFKND